MTLEKIWAMYQETDRRLKDMTLQLDQRFKETDRRISCLDCRVDDLVERLIVPSILGIFRDLGYDFDMVAPRMRYFDAEGHCIAEAGLLLEGRDTALVLEARTNLTVTDIENHVKRMETLRRCANEHDKKRKLLGAVTGIIALEGEKAFAIKQGFFVLEQSGDMINLRVPKDFKPKEW
jgi:hypothetical protein